ncbi:MAG: cell division protein FtsZ [Comamonadaceae bacterium CG1_02_60_18]|nr:MAG: cell division protein FtsZ [Comamonadaceae bacterium CG1_02_60_18]PIQ53729.1 MAG: cell division protein FtsZ [Comamonadaceae bacterium CG12_big_fil_rev_8_21_14_0_65_59_15]
MSIELIEEETFNQGTQIKVIGVGGGGGNAVAHMIASAVQGVEFICANTDAQALSTSDAHRIIQLGSTGLGAGSKPDKAREAAEVGVEHIREAIDGAHMLFITAGMGGGTGTGAAPVIARVAREMGILTVGVVTKPFEFEGKRRMENADQGLAELEANVDSLIVVLNEKLLEVLGDDATQDEAFAHANDVLKNAVGGIAEIINVPGHVNVDFEDVRTVMGEPGKAMMGTAVAAGPDRARIAAEQAVACPLLEGIDLSGAKGVLVLISAAKGSLKLSESKLAMNTIRAYASPDAHVIYGTAYDDHLGDQIRVTVVATGLSRQGRKPNISIVPTEIRRTGTDNMPVNVPTLDTPVSMGSVGSSMGSVMTGRTQPDYGSMATPSVWRTRDRTSAAAKVDALASGGMDDFEIPAFLRKQAD